MNRLRRLATASIIAITRRRRLRAFFGAVGCIRSQQLCAERPDCSSRPAADQQPDRLSAKSGADADQPGEESGDLAVLVVAAIGAVDPANTAASRPSPAHRLRHRADRPRILDDLRTGIIQPFGSGADRERANALAKCDGGLQDAMRTQATVVGNIDTNRTQMSALVTSSQGATGALQASQAGNQLLALAAQQLADLTARRRRAWTRTKPGVRAACRGPGPKQGAIAPVHDARRQAINPQPCRCFTDEYAEIQSHSRCQRPCRLSHSSPRPAPFRFGVTKRRRRSLEPGSTSSDPLAAKLAECRSVTYEQKDALTECRKAWAEKRRQFLGQDALPI